jgi:inner membrane protein
VTVRWLDMRYQHRKQYPFLAVVMYNQNMEPRFSYVGWISNEKLKKRLNQVNADE